MRWPLFLFLGVVVDAYLSRTFHFPHTSLYNGVHHIHTPEAFLSAYALCPEGFCIESVYPPQRVDNYHLVTFTVRTLLGRMMHARVFTDNDLESHFILTDEGHDGVLMGHLRVERLGSHGHAVRLHASRLRPFTAWEECVHPRRVLSDASIEASIRECAVNFVKDVRLREYRRRALRLGNWPTC